ncbi:MAG: radical SAM protein [Rhodospirillaceae bacterium]|nr:radical SAM protein [Rhodospirillales bacterium]
MPVHQTGRRTQIKDLDSLPRIDRSLIDYSAYHAFIGHAGVKHSMAIQATRGCPYRCFYCDIYKTAEHHFRRSVDSIFDEVLKLHDVGIRRIEFIDDIFNVKKKDFVEFFERVLKHKLDISFYFPTGLRGDLLDYPTIDLMVAAGAVGVNLSLEHAAERMQKIMRKNLQVDKLHDMLTYITEKHPSVILTLNAMHGFPTETEDEAMATLNFILSIKWIDFVYLHNVRIFPGTELEYFALQNGVPAELIAQSQDMSYHENSPTLPFTPEFSRRVKTSLLRDYVLNRERLLAVIPRQLEKFTENELDQKYNSYFPSASIKTLNDVLKMAKIDRAELKITKPFDEKSVLVDGLNERIRDAFATPIQSVATPLKLLLIDFSAYFSDASNTREYNVLEPPLGLLALQSYVNAKMPGKVTGRIIKPRIDFDSFDELVQIVADFAPDLIGIRAMTFYKRLMHDGVAYLRDKGIQTPIIIGGPYPSECYEEALEDGNIQMAAIGEGEEILTEILERMIANGNALPDRSEWSAIMGIAFRVPDQAVAEASVS